MFLPFGVQIRRTNPTESPSMATTSLYMDSSPDSSYDEEEFIKTNNHSYYMDYFPGPGDPEWQLNEHSIRVSVFNVPLNMEIFTAIFNNNPSLLFPNSGL
jgi:hypothetical protein